tara:strand:- start:35729 stop:35923 length:195 start_codon:yes stop_codon:yes gene_type:complete
MVIINMGMYVNDHGLKIGLTRMYQIFDQRKDVGNTIKFCLLEKVEESPIKWSSMAPESADFIFE